MSSATRPLPDVIDCAIQVIASIRKTNALATASHRDVLRAGVRYSIRLRLGSTLVALKNWPQLSA